MHLLFNCVCECVCMFTSCMYNTYIYICIHFDLHTYYSYSPTGSINHDLQTIKKIPSRIFFSQAAFCFPWESGEHCHRQSGQVELLGVRSVQDLSWVEMVEDVSGGGSICNLHPGRLSWRIGRSFSFLIGWFVGSMLIFQGVWIVTIQTYMIPILSVICVIFYLIIKLW